jgi:hypothetical protein
MAASIGGSRGTRRARIPVRRPPTLCEITQATFELLRGEIRFSGFAASSILTFWEATFTEICNPELSTSKSDFQGSYTVSGRSEIGRGFSDEETTRKAAPGVPGGIAEPAAGRLDAPFRLRSCANGGLVMSKARSNGAARTKCASAEMPACPDGLAAVAVQRRRSGGGEVVTAGGACAAPAGRRCACPAGDFCCPQGVGCSENSHHSDFSGAVRSEMPDSLKASIWK